MPPFSLFFASLCLLLIGSSFGEDNHLKKEELQPKVSRPDVAICEGSISAFFVSDNMNIRGANASAVIRGVNEKQCTDFCVHNQDHKGRTVLCASAVYESEAQECQLFRQASFPDGQMERKAEEGRRYFEKFCLPEEAPVDCANRQFVRVDDYILKGYAQSTTTVSTMADCVAYCMREREFECKSAMFFYEEGECITNLESAITAPDDFQRPDDEDKVIFFHNGCILPGAGSAPPQDGHFEVAQSQDSLKSTATASSALTAGGEESAERAIQQSPSSPSPSTTSFPPPSSSSTPPAAEPTPAEEPESPQNSIIGSNGPAPQQPPSITAESPTISSSTQLAEITSTPPDRADEIPAAVDNTKVGEEEQRKEKEEEESEEDGQKLEESAAAHQPLLGGAAAEEPEAGDGPKAVPVPPAATERLETEQQQQQPRVHPKQLALAGQQEQQQRQYGAKTIERAPDGSFQEKVAEVAGSVNPVADGSSSSPSAIAKGPSNRKGPESTKRLQLKLIKDQQQQPKPDILSVTLAPPQPAAQPSLPTSLGPSASPSSPPPPLPSTRQPTQPASPASNIAPGGVAEDGQTAAEDEQQAEQSAEERFEGTEGYFSRWGQWTPCQVPGERRVRRRKCLDLRRCKGALMQVDYCPRDIPPPPPPSDKQEALGDAAQAPAAEEQRQPQPPLNRPVLHGQPQAEVLPAAPEAPSRQPLPIDLSRVAPAEGQPPAIMPPSQDQENQKPQPLPAGAPAPRPPTPIEEEVAIWSAWNGTCQHFASSQPCKDGQVIGFESRECVAKDPLACKGPFFRYCVLPC